jgi:hypothetical protein
MGLQALKNTYNSIKSSYSDVGALLADYFSAYGGKKALLLSPYLHFSILLCALSFPFWTFEDWEALVFSIIPAMLGFTIATFAIVISLGTSKILRVLLEKDDDEKHSVIIQVAATFAHFSLVQICMLLLAFLSKSGLPTLILQHFVPTEVFSSKANLREIVYLSLKAFGFFFFLYAITLSIAAVLGLFRITNWMAMIMPHINDGECKCGTVNKDNQDAEKN